tara:strand:- start:424 stop:1350 length:927 start_codon:yes stop_codon:yes gene_type:complete
MRKYHLFIVFIIILIFVLVIEPKNYNRIVEATQRLRGLVSIIWELPCPNIIKTRYDHDEEYKRNLLIQNREIHNIPNNIFQIYINNDKIPNEIVSNINFIKNNNKGWKYYLITDKNVNMWFKDMNDPTFKIIYDDISVSYPAAKCDLLRYLLMKHYGGVYLDIKSSSKYPLDDIIEPKIMLFNWCFFHTKFVNICGLSGSKRKRKTDNEIAQWVLIYPKGHFFIDAVLKRLKVVYNEYKNDKNINQCIYHFTGPDNYTDSVSELANSENSILYPSFVDKGLEYNSLSSSHMCYSKGKHYLNVKGKIIY